MPTAILSPKIKQSIIFFYANNLIYDKMSHTYLYRISLFLALSINFFTLTENALPVFVKLFFWDAQRSLFTTFGHINFSKHDCSLGYSPSSIPFDQRAPYDFSVVYVHAQLVHMEHRSNASWLLLVYGCLYDDYMNGKQ